MERECYDEEVQPYRKMDYKPIIYIIWHLVNNLIGLQVKKLTIKPGLVVEIANLAVKYH